MVSCSRATRLRLAAVLSGAIAVTALPALSNPASARSIMTR